MASTKLRCAYTNECGNQCKFRQSLARLRLLSSTDACLFYRKLAQKHGFKAPGGSSSKLAKAAIDRTQKKLDRAHSACDCCIHLKEHQSKCESDPKWQRYVEEQSPRILKKSPHVADRVLICLGVKN